MFKPSSNLVVVIRSVDERTTSACKELVFRQVSQQQVHLVREFPFEAALRRCYEIGIESGATWMMTLDADVLLREGAIQDFLTQAEALPEEYFQLEGLLHDKLAGQYRKVGHRMYRTQYLQKALDSIPAPREAIRPERTTLRRMEQLGYPSKEIKVVFGIHDYEQFYADIYRKAFVHAKKHPDRFRDFIERWSRQMAGDPDFKVALKGLCDGLTFNHSVAIDKREFKHKSEAALEDLGLIEKEKIIEIKQCIPLIRSKLIDLCPQSHQPISGDDIQKTEKTQKLRHIYCQLGLGKTFLYLTGAGIIRMGNLLKDYASRNHR